MALPKKNRLTKKGDFDRVFQEGKTVKGSFLFVKFLPSELFRIGINVSSKAFKKATERNRIKRVISEKIKDIVKRSLKLDVIVIINKKKEEKEILQELADIFKKVL